MTMHASDTLQTALPEQHPVHIANGIARATSAGSNESATAASFEVASRASGEAFSREVSFDLQDSRGTRCHDQEVTTASQSDPHQPAM